MKKNRKYVTEYGFGYMNSFTSMVTAYQLMKGGAMSEEMQNELSKCHLYIIAARPLPYFDPESLKHENNMLSGKLCYKVKGEEFKVVFKDYRWKLEDNAVSVSCNYPHKEIVSLDENNKETDIYLPASYLASKLNERCFNDYEVLYVGQALGNQGNRSALERLKSHSTFQKIMGMTNHEYPDQEIMIFMYQFDNKQIFTSIDGAAKGADMSDDNEARLQEAAKNPPKKKQEIGMIEAALIRYFRPHYNEIYKIKFPSTKHKVLKSCYDLDATGIVVELNSTDLNYSLYSDAAPISDHHIVQIDLVSSENRMSFFYGTNLPTNNPEIIS